MFTNVWSRYLPIIRIVLKKSLGEDQVLRLNVSDFERAGLKRKSGYKFTIVASKGKLKNVIIDLPLASSLANVLLQDAALREVMAANEFEISLNPKFELSIRHIPQAPEKVEEPVSENSAG